MTCCSTLTINDRRLLNLRTVGLLKRFCRRSRCLNYTGPLNYSGSIDA